MLRPLPARRAAAAALVAAGALASCAGTVAARTAAGHHTLAPATLTQPLYPPVVAQALAALAGHVGSLPLGAPTTLPPEPPSHTYLTAITRVRSDAWQVEVLKADQAYAVNNPAILSAQAHAVPVVAFGAARLTAALPRAARARALALWRTGQSARGVPDGAAPPVPSGRPAAHVGLGDGIVAEVYAEAGGTATVSWREGEWTLCVVDTTLATATALARPMVAYLHGAFLPPDPGLVVVAIGVHGVYTRVDWRAGSVLYYADDDLRFGMNPVSACTLAVSWRAG